ncbi:unnamed protein product [Nezara viridula]|uniref:Uncharacterized protein n=1 Tax=Nezara viridula TaxID=85310 RepID=A0A9P0MST2_NEZVI|nr:unnamed protein product [Nezara viridula]
MRISPMYFIQSFGVILSFFIPWSIMWFRYMPLRLTEREPPIGRLFFIK